MHFVPLEQFSDLNWRQSVPNNSNQWGKFAKQAWWAHWMTQTKGRNSNKWTKKSEMSSFPWSWFSLNLAGSEKRRLDSTWRPEAATMCWTNYFATSAIHYFKSQCCHLWRIIVWVSWVNHAVIFVCTDKLCIWLTRSTRVGEPVTKPLR